MSIEVGYKLYQAERREGEIDLISAFRNLMLEVGLHKKVAEHYDTNPFIKEAASKLPQVQRYFLNRFITIQLFKARESTIRQRSDLIPDGTDSDWLAIVKASIIPCFLSNDLPSALE